LQTSFTSNPGRKKGKLMSVMHSSYAILSDLDPFLYLSTKIAEEPFHRNTQFGVPWKWNLLTSQYKQTAIDFPLDNAKMNSENF
jgi:hypothetical protein